MRARVYAHDVGTAENTLRAPPPIRNNVLLNERGVRCGEPQHRSLCRDRAGGWCSNFVSARLLYYSDCSRPIAHFQADVLCTWSRCANVCSVCVFISVCVDPSNQPRRPSEKHNLPLLRRFYASFQWPWTPSPLYMANNIGNNIVVNRIDYVELFCFDS